MFSCIYVLWLLVGLSTSVCNWELQVFGMTVAKVICIFFAISCFLFLGFGQV